MCAFPTNTTPFELFPEVSPNINPSPASSPAVPLPSLHFSELGATESVPSGRRAPPLPEGSNYERVEHASHLSWRGSVASVSRADRISMESPVPSGRRAPPLREDMIAYQPAQYSQSSWGSYRFDNGAEAPQQRLSEVRQIPRRTARNPPSWGTVDSLDNPSKRKEVCRLHRTVNRKLQVFHSQACRPPNAAHSGRLAKVSL
jgi:hypothetical protein